MANVISKTAVNLIPDTSIVVNGETFYKEDANGYICGQLIVYDNDEKIMTVIHKPADSSYEKRELSFFVKEFLYSPSMGTWSKFITGRFKNDGYSSFMTVDDNEFCDPETGIPNLNPDLTDTEPIYLSGSNTIIGYSKNNSVYLLTEYEFWRLSIGSIIFNSMSGSVLVRF